MLRLLLILLLCWMTTSVTLAQDTTFQLSTRMFDKRQRLELATLPGWVFQLGHNPTWAKPGLNTARWVKRSPADLSAKDADHAGKAEGWFRLRIRLDSTFKGIPLGVINRAYAATEVYIDGQLVASFGSTGTLDKPYAEYSPWYKPGLAVPLEAGKDYLIAIHIVDMVFPFPPFPPKKLKSEFYTPIRVGLTRPQTTARLISDAEEYAGFVTLCFTVSLLLALLFWVLSTQELPEKNTIRLWAIVETLFALSNLCRYVDLVDTSFTFYYVIDQLMTVLLWPSLSLSLIAFLRVFGYRIPNKWIGIGLLVSLGGAILNVYGAWLVFYGVCLFQLLFFVYVIIVSWKRLKGALWAIVVGYSVTLLFTLLLAIVFLTQKGDMLFFILSGALLSLPLSFLVYLAFRFKETLAEVRTNAAAVVLVTEEKRALLASQNEQLEQQVEARTAELKASQQQLIQTEKMASLGELTAGIAHEIQNPLNFVTNFSEVSAELVDELKEGPFQQLPQADKAYADELLGDLTQNLEKITQHGQRASSIVKGMLEHSRPTTGERQLTDLNALCEEYLRLAYHGLRAKDNTLNCELVTDFDLDLGLVEVVPQEMGRVLLNLFNNAFYATQQRKHQSTVAADYQPQVTVCTKRVEHAIAIRVRDNGIGVPESVKQKIFQPFFTTKPTGEGTGLGLSLAYDIITKGHGGTLALSSQEGEWTEFVITLPAS